MLVLCFLYIEIRRLFFIFQAMMKDQFANYVVQKVLETSNGRQREILLKLIRVHIDALKKYTYGKHIVVRFQQLSGEGLSISRL